MPARKPAKTKTQLEVEARDAKLQRKLGRPVTCTPILSEYIAQELAKGRSLTSICRDPGVPPHGAVSRWLYTPDPSDEVVHFRRVYAEARQAQAEMFADGIIDISDDGRNDWMERNDPDNPGYKFNGEHYMRSRLRADNRKWVAARILAHRFGDKVKVETEAQDSGPKLDYNLLTKEERATLRDLIEKATPK